MPKRNANGLEERYKPIGLAEMAVCRGQRH